jgi:signal peptidase I
VNRERLDPGTTASKLPGLAGVREATRAEWIEVHGEPPPALPVRDTTAEPLASGELSAGELLSTLEVEPELDAPKRGPRWKRGVAAAQLACLTLFVYVALFNVSVVRGSSMAPGIHDGDRIVIDHFAYMLGSVQRGDIVVLKYPLDPSLDYIKRVIGLPGDEVMIDQGHVWVNGKELTEPYVASADPLSRTYVHVQPAHYFVLGDNRPRSSDSREFGQVPMDYVRGRVELRLWPISRIGAVR